MNELDEVEVHERAEQLFERENAGRLWRSKKRLAAANTAGLVERQNYLVRARQELRAASAKETE